MPRQRNPLPIYRLHQKTGRAVVTVRNHLDARHDILLPGAYDSPESRKEYERILAVILANRGRLPMPNAAPPDLTVTELVAKYMDEHATAYYVDPATGKPTGEVECLTLAFRALNRLYGPTPAVEFDSLKLEVLQQAMACGSWLTEAEREERRKRNKPAGLARRTLNQRIDRVKRLFRWGCSKKLVPADVVVNLQTVAGLKRGRSAARETEDVGPVDPEVAERTIVAMTPAAPVTADLVRVLLLTGARVGEICALTGAELDRTGPVWLYRPAEHKGRHRGHKRVIAFGPQAQLILRRYLKADPEAALFSPAEQYELVKATRRADRKTPVQPSQVDRSKPDAKRKPGDRYTPDGVNLAIRRACLKLGIPIWHTHQLRHTRALEVEREYGLEAARALLGHRQVNVTTMYAGLDAKRAAEVAAKIG